MQMIQEKSVLSACQNQETPLCCHVGICVCAVNVQNFSGCRRIVALFVADQ